MKMGNTETARTNLQKAQELFTAQGNTAAGAEEVANILQQINTETSNSEAISINPNDAQTHYDRGNLYLNQGKIDLAFIEYNQTLQIDPNFVKAYVNRGIVYFNQGKLDLALADYERAIEIDPNFALGYYNRGLVYQQQGQLDLAEADYRKALQLDPNLTQASQSLNSL